MTGLSNKIFKNPPGFENSTRDKTGLVLWPKTIEHREKVHRGPDSGQHKDLVSNKHSFLKADTFLSLIKFSFIFGDYLERFLPCTKGWT